MRRISFSLLILALFALTIPVFAQSTATPALIPTTTPTPLPATATPTPAAELPASDLGVISVGESFEGSLTSDEPSMTFALQGEAGQVVSLTLTSDDFDTYLTVLDSSGNVVAFNDDSNGERNSRIPNVTLPENDSYSVLVESYGQHVGSSAQEGDFVLSVGELQVRRIEYTQSIDGELTSSELSHDYVFTGSSGDTIIVNLSSEDFDAYLRLRDPNGTEVLTNDDSGGSLNSQLGPYILPETGSYTINASSLGGSDTGDYELRLSRVESQTIAYGDTVELEFTEGDREFFLTFQGAYGDIVSAYADSDRGVDTSLTLNDTYNSQLAFDDDSGSGYDPEILGVSLYSDGVYTLLVRAADDANGTVSVTLERVPPLSLDEGAQSLSFSSSQTQFPVVFTGEAGEKVRLTFAVQDDAQSSSLSISARQNGTSVSDFSGYNLSTASIEFTVPSDGEVMLTVSEYSYSNIEIEVSVEHLD